MDYEKAYKEALERARKVKHDVQLIGCAMNADMLEVVFPELEESEDEMIRKELKKLFELELTLVPSRKSPEFWESALAWLENQKEYIEDIRQYAYNKGLMDAEEKQKPAELPKSEDYGIDGLYAAVDILQKTLGEVDGYQTDDGILEHKCAISAVKELYEQKPTEWSEEDESRLNHLILFVKKYGSEYYSNIDNVLAWLKSLRPQSHWKPSEEHFQALRRAIIKADKGLDAEKWLKDLYEQLKRL